MFHSAPLRRPDSQCTLSVQRSARVCGRCARAFPARSPLLPALTGSLRAASIFPTSPPHRAIGRGREHYSSTTRVNRQEGDQSGNALGGNPEPPERPKPPGSRFSPRPPFLPPQHHSARRAHDQGKRKQDQAAAVQMTVETARQTGPHDHGQRERRCPCAWPQAHTAPYRPKGNGPGQAEGAPSRREGTPRCLLRSANQRLTFAANARQAFAVNASLAPPGSVESRTSTAPRDSGDLGAVAAAVAAVAALPPVGALMPSIVPQLPSRSSPWTPHRAAPWTGDYRTSAPAAPSSDGSSTVSPSAAVSRYAIGGESSSSAMTNAPSSPECAPAAVRDDLDRDVRLPRQLHQVAELHAT